MGLSCSHPALHPIPSHHTLCPNDVLGGSSLTCLTRFPLSHAVESLSLSLSRRQSTMLWCQDLEQENLCKWHDLLCVIAVTRCSERCDDTCSTRVSRDTKSSATNHPWPDCRFRRDLYLVTILRVISESAQLFANCSNCSFCEAVAR